MPLEDEFPDDTTAISFFRSQGLPETVIRRVLERRRAQVGGPDPSRGSLQDLLAPIGRLHTRAERLTESVRAPIGRAVRETLEEVPASGEQFTQGLRDVLKAVREGRDPSALLAGVVETGLAPLRLAGAPFTGFLINPFGRLVGPGLSPLSRSLLGEENVEALSRLGEAVGVGRTAEEFARFGAGLATVPLGRMLGEFGTRTPRGPSVVEAPLGLAEPGLPEPATPPPPPPSPRALASAPFEVSPSGETIPPGLTFEEGLGRILAQQFGISETEAGAVAEAQRMGRPPSIQEPPAAPPSPPSSIGRPKRGGRPRSRIGVPDLSDDEASLFAAAGLRRSGLTTEVVQDLVSKMEPLQMRALAAEEVRQARIDAGELTGKRGAPKGQVARVIQRSPEMMAQIADLDSETADIVPRGIVVDVVSRDLKRREVRFTEEPPSLRPAVGLATFRKLADAKGYDLKIIGSGNYELIGLGGEVHKHLELGTATEFLMKLPDVTKEPIENKTPIIEPRVHARLVRKRSKVSQEVAEQVPVPEVSTIDKIIKGLPLNKDDEINLQKQRLVVEKQLADIGPLGDVEEAVSVEKPDTVTTARIGLDEGKLVGSVEDLRTRGDVARVLRKAHSADMRTQVLRTPTGFEVVYYKTATPEIRAAINFHSRVLNEGPRAVSDDAHRLMGRVFGVPDDQINSFLDTLHGRRRTPDVGDAHIVPPPTEPRDPREGFPRPLPPIPVEGRLILPITQPAQSASLLINNLQVDIDVANASVARASVSAGQAREKLVSAGRDDATQKRIMKWVQGELKDDALTQAERDGGEAYRRTVQSLARQQGTPEDMYYATHVTDFNTLYNGVRDVILPVDRVTDLDPQFQLHFASDKDFNTWKRVLSRHSRWETIPRMLRERMKKELFNFNEVTDWEALPRFIREALPEEIFVPYLLARRANVPYIENALKAFDAYVPRMIRKIHFDPVIEKWQPVIDNLPELTNVKGPPGPFEKGFSEKGYMQRQMNVHVFRRPGAEERALQWVFDRVNNAFGRELLTVSRAQAAATLSRGAFIRGALGLDTAFREMNRIWLTMVQGGSSRTMRALVKHIEVWKTAREYQGLMGDFYKITRDQFVNDRAFEAALYADKVLNKIILAPEAFVEMANRGFAVTVGLAEAEARGLSPLMGLTNGAVRANEYLANLELSDQLRFALFEFMPRSQFYGTSAQRPPIFTGPFGRLGTVLTRYPSGLAGFHIQGLRESGGAIKAAIMDQGFREGLADAFHQGEVGKLARYMASIGFLFFLPSLLAKAGIDARRFFGTQHAINDLSLPAFTQVYNAYSATMGRSPVYRDKAKDTFKEFMLMMAVPQRRYGKKVGEVISNIERGYAVDKKNRYLYDATPFGELIKLAGFGPEEAFDVRQTARAKLEETYRYHNAKREAIDAMLDGDAGPAQDFFEKYGIPIKQEDLARAARERQTTPLQRSQRGLPRALRSLGP